VTTPQDRLTIEGLRQTVAAQAAIIATLRETLDSERAECVRLRAALDELAAAATDVYAATIDPADNYCFSCHDTLPCAHDALRAALAAAGEADHDPD
jgi:uncharacterized coiled-coil protein SlyX